MHRRSVLLALAAAVAAPSLASADAPRLHVAKSAGCGCCAAWVERMEDAGFSAETEDMDHGSLVALKIRLGLTDAHASCRTARIEGYVVAGDVPAEDVRRLPAERSDALGLAVPGMPVGSPGMERGDVREPCDVLLLDRRGGASAFSSR